MPGLRAQGEAMISLTPTVPTVFPQVYVAGSYSADRQIDIQGNVLRALQVAQQLIGLYRVLPIVPHSMGLHHGTSWDSAMIRCREIIHSLAPGRDVVVMLPGWQASRGATEERELALSLGIRVYELAEVVR